MSLTPDDIHNMHPGEAYKLHTSLEMIKQTSEFDSSITDGEEDPAHSRYGHVWGGERI